MLELAHARPATRTRIRRRMRYVTPSRARRTPLARTSLQHYRHIHGHPPLARLRRTHDHRTTPYPHRSRRASQTQKLAPLPRTRQHHTRKALTMPTTSRTKKPAEPAFTEQPETPLALVTTDAPTEPTPEAAPEPIPWAELLSAATVVDRNLDKHRPGIEVPPEVLVFTQTLLNSKNAAYLPVANAQDYKLKKRSSRQPRTKPPPSLPPPSYPPTKTRKHLAKTSTTSPSYASQSENDAAPRDDAPPPPPHPPRRTLREPTPRIPPHSLRRQTPDASRITTHNRRTTAPGTLRKTGMPLLRHTFTDECITHDPNSVVVALLAHQMRDHWEELVIARQAMMSAIERGKPLEYVPNPDMCHDQNCVLADILGFPHEIAEHKRVQQETPT
jgi:hypothetical protein